MTTIQHHSPQTPHANSETKKKKKKKKKNEKSKIPNSTNFFFFIDPPTFSYYYPWFEACTRASHTDIHCHVHFFCNMAEETQVLRISIYTPLIYVAVVTTAFVAFSIFYRRRRLAKMLNVEPIFGRNYSLELYTSVKDRYFDKLLPKEGRPPEKVVKAALLRRGVEAIRRSLKLKENEPVFNKLYQDGLIGDDVFRQFELQNKVQQLELQEIVEECQKFSKEWPAMFFPVAQEICYNEALRRRLHAMDDRSESLLELWNYYVEKLEKLEKPEAKEVKELEN